MGEPKKTDVDVIALELVNNSLTSIIDTMALTMCRTCYSHVVREIFDFATGLTDADGNIVAEGRVNPSHSGVMPTTVRTIRKIWGDRIYPGDVFMCNDPFEGASHLPDIYTIRPVFIDNELVAFCGSIAHQLDVGGRTPGSNACDNTEIFQEGVRIPPLKYYERGVRNYTLYRILEKNVRIHEKVLGDLESQVAGTTIGEKRFIELAQHWGGWPTLKKHISNLLDYSERMTRAAIKELPDGSWEFEDFMDDDGFSPDPVRFHVKITIKGEDITFDLTGSSRQTRGSINLPYTSTLGVIYTGVRVLINPEVPANGGVHRAVKIIAPPGTVVNAAFPIGVAGRGATIGRLWDAVLGALAKIAPDRVPADTTGIDYGVCLGGTDSSGNPVVFTDFLMGSWGGRPNADGISACTSPWMNYSVDQAEPIEHSNPLRIEQYSLVPDSGGAGKYRGGLGMVRDYRLLFNDPLVQWRVDRADFPAWGLAGGKPGALAESYHISGRKKRKLRKSIFIANNGDLLRAILPGAGGWGPPYERDIERVVTDVRNEKVSPEAARRDYGVAIDPVTFEVDRKETKRLRGEMKKAADTKTS
ncbi:MAG: hydantoinase B/oxoprolinase family protein [Chloroflexota bacterium]